MNEAKEKAEELAWKYLPILEGWTDNSKTELAKQCAIIAVKEMQKFLGKIEENETADFAFGGSFKGDEYHKFLNDVLIEIEKL